jgi:hypothetical protein
VNKGVMGCYFSWGGKANNIVRGGLFQQLVVEVV